jgi:multicomponent Na+:H+ antiporter subunit B
MAAAIILHALVFGLRETMTAIPPRVARSVASLGVLIYAGVGVVCMINGGGFLDYDYLIPPAVEVELPGWILGNIGHAPHWGQHIGILAIEIGVLLTVTATMVTVFYGFAGRTVEDARREARR